MPDRGRRLSNFLLSLGCVHGRGVHGEPVHCFSLAMEMTNVSCRSHTRRPRCDLATRRRWPCEQGARRFARRQSPRPWPCFVNGYLMYLRNRYETNSMMSLQVEPICSNEATTSATTRPADKRGGIIQISLRQISYPLYSSRELCR